MLERLRKFTKTEYEKILSGSIKPRKNSASNVAGKLLALFFILMLVFTIISRTAASISVASVTVQNPQRSKLTYSVSGTGEIILEDEKRILVLPGYRIDDVYVKAGEQVSVGTVLFRYDMDDIEEKYSDIETQIKKINLEISKEKLRQEPVEVKPSQTALLSLKQAEENLEVAKKKLEKAQKDYEDSISITKEKLLENKRNEYDDKLKNYDSILFSQNKQLIMAQRIVDDAESALLQANKEETQIITLLDNYKEAVLSKDKLATFKAQEAIFEFYYGGADSYEEHKNAVFNAAIAMYGEDRILYMIQNNISNYEELITTTYNDLQKAQNSTDSSTSSNVLKTLNERYKNAVESYLYYIDEYDRKIDLMGVINTNESYELRKLIKDDRKLKDNILKFRTAIEAGSDYQNIRNDIYDFILGDKKNDIAKDIDNKKLALTRAKEDYDLLVKEFETQKNNAQAELNELKDIIKQIEEGTYDFSGELEVKKQAVEAAEEMVRTALQAVEMQKLPNEVQDDKVSRMISDLVIQGYEIDLKLLEKELDEIKNLMGSSGEVISPYEGVIAFVGVEAGKTTAGGEMIKVCYGDYLFKATFDRDEAVNVGIGSTVNVTLPGKKLSTEAVIDNITITENGKSEFIAKMPDKDYLLGQKADFKITSQSDTFDLCIPIQALREDNFGYYVLVTRTQEDILGTELIAERVQVNVLDRGNNMVAVEGALSNKSSVIIDSNKYINTGDRVRIK